MDITIIGAGAMGSLFGSLLTQSGQNVLLMDIWEEHVNAINGAIVSMAQKKSIPVPVNHTLTALIQTLQKNF